MDKKLEKRITNTRTGSTNIKNKKLLVKYIFGLLIILTHGHARAHTPESCTDSVGNEYQTALNNFEIATKNWQIARQVSNEAEQEREDAFNRLTRAFGDITREKNEEAKKALWSRYEQMKIELQKAEKKVYATGIQWKKANTAVQNAHNELKRVQKKRSTSVSPPRDSR